MADEYVVVGWQDVAERYAKEVDRLAAENARLQRMMEAGKLRAELERLAEMGEHWAKAYADQPSVAECFKEIGEDARAALAGGRCPP